MVKFRWEKEFKETPIGEIPKDWEVREVQEVSKVNPENISKKDSFRFIEYIDINSVEEGTIKEVKILELKSAPSRAKRKVKAGDVIISTVRPRLRHFAFIKEVNPNTIVSTGFAVVRATNINSKFLYYCLITDNVTEYLSQIAEEHASTYPAFTPDVLMNLKIPYPSPDEQKRIATVLSWFDELIENKRRQNEILEKVAMAIFKSWFIDFEPFQDEEFVYSEELDREIPKGWEVGKLVEMGEIIMGQSPPSKAYNLEGDGYPFVQGMGQFGLYVPNTDTYSKIITKLSKPYDVLITVRAPIGELNIADRCYVLGRGVSAIRSEFWPFVYLYLKVFNELLKSYERGTTFEAITKSELENFPILIPPKPILEKFHSLVEPLFRKILINEKEVLYLKKTRNLLLPHLIFGRLRVEVV